MYTYLMMVMLFCIGMIVTLGSISLVSKMLETSGLLKQNYKGEMIPISMGICFIPAMLINASILSYGNIDSMRLIKILVLLFGMMSMAFAGFLDDCLGSRKESGLMGHFKALIKGKLTTGAFKAILGGLIGLIVSSIMYNTVLEIVVGTLIIALSTNFMNLLDLRPGRAIKVYLFISVLIFLFSSTFNKELMMIIVPAVIAYFYYDLKAISMMGDAGSNVIGISIGIFFVIFFGFEVQVAWLILLIVIHFITEKYSLTKLIEKNAALDFIDKLGRE